MPMPVAVALLGLLAITVALVAWSRVRRTGAPRARPTTRIGGSEADAALLSIATTSTPDTSCADGGSGGGCD